MKLFDLFLIYKMKLRTIKIGYNEQLGTGQIRGSLELGGYVEWMKYLFDIIKIIITERHCSKQNFSYRFCIGSRVPIFHSPSERRMRRAGQETRIRPTRHLSTRTFEMPENRDPIPGVNFTNMFTGSFCTFYFTASIYISPIFMHNLAPNSSIGDN